MNKRYSALLYCLLLLGSLFVLRLPVQAADVGPGYQVELVATGKDAFTKVPPPAQFSGPLTRLAKTATFSVTYHGFSPQAQSAFQHAVDIWSTLITSSVPIKVDATWKVMSPGILGSCGPKWTRRDFSGAPQAGTWYPIALADARHGSDMDPSDPDIVANFSSVFTWYFGTDGNCPAGQVDFVSVVLHELCHGLGFLGTAGYDSATSKGYIKNDGYPMQYDRLVVNGSGTAILSYTSGTTALGSQLVSNNLFFNGSNTKAANGGVRPKLYVPTSWNGGSSYAHWDDATYPPGNPNSLMTHALNSAEAIHTPGAITLGLFRDLGWTTATDTPKTDAWVRTAAGSYLGDNVYNTTGTGQTVSQFVTAGSIAGYYLRVQNDGTCNDAFRITGTVSDANWTIRYINADTGVDLTSFITSTNQLTTKMLLPGEAAWYYVTVLPRSGLAARTTKAVTITTRSQANLNSVDVVKMNTTTLLVQPDGLVRNINVASYAGNNIYNTNGTSQTSSWAVRRGQTATFYVRFENDGNDTDSFKITGYAGAAGYHVVYTDLATGTNITSQVTGSGWNTGALLPNGYKLIRITVSPDSTISEGGAQALLVTATSTRVGFSTKKDAVKVIVSVIKDQPDLQVKTSGEASFIGNNIYNDSGINQEKVITLANNGITATFNVLVQNDSTANDSIKVVGWPGAASWHVVYKDPANANITAAVTGSGWTSPSLAPGASVIITVTVSPDSTVTPGRAQTLLVTGRSLGTSSKVDAIKCKTQILNYQPDMWIRNIAEATYTGDNIYNLLGTGQSKAQTVANGVTAWYPLRIQNDGNATDNFIVTGWAGAAAYNVKYYNAATGANITAQVASAGGWNTGPVLPAASVGINITVTPNSTLSGSAAQKLQINAASVARPTQRDVVTCTTTVATRYAPDIMTRLVSDAAYAGDNIYNSDATGQTKTQMVKPASKTTYLFKVQNDGNIPDTLSVTSVTPLAIPVGWIVKYFDTTTKADITSQINGNGWSTGVLAPRASKNIIAEVSVTNVPASTTMTVSLAVRSLAWKNGIDVAKMVANLIVYKPDAQIRRALDKVYTGNNIYNTNGAGQTVNSNITLAGPVAYYLRIQNDGTVTDSYRITGTAGDKIWVVQYMTVIGSSNITTDVTGSGVLTVAIAPGGFLDIIWYQVAVNPNVTSGMSYNDKVTVKSVGDPTKIDVVCSNTTYMP